MASKQQTAAIVFSAGACLAGVLLAAPAARADGAENEKALWLSSKLRGSDNRVASLREVKITEDGGKYSIFIKNQFRFLCELEFSRLGFPEKISNCVSQIKEGDEDYSPGQTWKFRKDIQLHCVPSKSEVVCTGNSELFVAELDYPGQKYKDYVTIVRPAASKAGIEKK